MRIAGAPKLGGIGSAGGEPSAAFERQPHRAREKARNRRIETEAYLGYPRSARGQAGS